MGLFKSWYEAASMGSNGTESLPTQSAQNAANIAQQFMTDPKNVGSMNKLTAAAGHPSLMQRSGLEIATQAADQSGLRQDQIKTNTPAIAGVMINKLAPTAKNPFAQSIKPV